MDRILPRAVPFEAMGRGWLAAGLVVVGFGLFGAILALVGPDVVWRQVQALGPLGFLAMVGNDLAATLFWVGSWGILLRAYGIRLKWQEMAGISMAGFAVSYLTPVAYAGGEPVRAGLVSHKTGFPLTTAFATLFVDRLLAGLSLIAFALLGGAFTLQGEALSPAAKVQVGLGLFMVTAAVTLGVWSFARNLHWLSGIVAGLGWLRRSWRRPALWAAKVREMEEQVHAAFSRHLPSTALALLLQLASFLCTYLRPQLFFYFTRGRIFSIPELAAYFNLNAILTTVLWMTPAGLGTAEGGRVGILSLVGITAPEAMAFSLTVRFLELLVVGVGLAYLVREGLLFLAGKNLPVGRVAEGVRRGLGAVRGALEMGSLYVYGILLRPWLPGIFAWRYRRPDPWNYETSPYEKRKYEQKLQLLPRRPDPRSPPYARVLDLGCGEGVFTSRLAREGVGREVVGVDFVPAALERARARCRDLPRVEFLLLDITRDLPEGEFDLVFCSEVLYYLGAGKIRELADRLCPKISPGGHVILVSAWPAGRLVHRPFLNRPDLVLVGEHVERTPSRPYVITCLERVDRWAETGLEARHRSRLGAQSSPGNARW